MKLSLFVVLLAVAMAYGVPISETNAVEPEAPAPAKENTEAAPEDDLKTDATFWGGFYKPYYSGWNTGYYRPRSYYSGWGGYGGYGYGNGWNSWNNGWGNGWNNGYGYWR